MLGFFIGTVCVLGMIGVVRRVAWGHRAHGGRGCRRTWRGRRATGPFGNEGYARAAGEVFKRRLDIDEEQEGIVDHALHDLHGALKELAGEMKASRAPIAEAFRGESVDDAALAAAFARHDDALTRARREVVSALKQVHAVLTPEQRATAADWVATRDATWL